MNYRGTIPRGTIFIEVTISAELRDGCVSLFGNLKECSTPENLTAFAAVKELELVKLCVPTSSELVYNELIKRLMSVGRSFTEPALFILLDALARKYQGLVEEKECLNLIESLKTELAKSATFEQAKDYERLVVRNAPNDLSGIDKLAEQWIEEAGNNPDELALRITLSVFNGTTFEMIEKIKNDLLERLQQIAPQVKLFTLIPTASQIPLMRRLEKAGARETDGKPPDWRKVIVLDKQEIAGAAISYVWRLNRETKWRQVLVEWLTKYAAGHAVHIRTRAAVAAGILAIKDYRFVRDHMLDRWVRENNAEYRMAVGMALGVIAREEHLAEETQNLLQQWSESDRLDERWVAVRAYIYVGQYCRPVSKVITRWREIADSESDSSYIVLSSFEPPKILNSPLYMSLMDAMMRFFYYVAQQPTEEKRSIYTGILEGLHNWIADDKRDAWLGLFMFFMIGDMHIISDEQENADNPPLLLQLMDEQPSQTEYRKQLAALLELLMRKGATIVDAKRLLSSWLGWVNGLQRSSPLYETVIQTLMKDMIAADSSGRIRGKLAACLRDCGRNRTAQRILATL